MLPSRTAYFPIISKIYSSFLSNFSVYLRLTAVKYPCMSKAGAGLEAGVISSFLALVPETHAFHDILSKIFRKKIKRAKVDGTAHFGG